MKVFVIGLDCAPPKIVFEQCRHLLPNLSKLMAAGCYAPLLSSDPPITVPAWMCMLTGKDSGELGFYGFRNRKDYSYNSLVFANSLAVKEPTVWDLLSAAGKKSILVGVPQTYPPKPLNGLVVTDILTPSKESQWTYPASLQAEVEAVTGGYSFDVKEFRTPDKEYLLEQVFLMTEKRFKLARHLAVTKPWDFFMLVEMGPDRLQHGFWRYFDPTHRLFTPNNKYQRVIAEYYQFLDTKIGQLLAVLPKDSIVLVVSDHGAKAMAGGVCINDWLRQEGYLKLKSEPKESQKLDLALVDWQQTVAWGEGGYYSRIFLNVKDREPEGLVAPSNYQEVRLELKEKLEKMLDHQGQPLNNKVLLPEEIYKATKNIPPDLMVYFGDLNWRSVGTVGNSSIYVFENDTGPDDANHDYWGIFIASYLDGRKLPWQQKEYYSIYDVMPLLTKTVYSVSPDLTSDISCKS